MNASDDNYVMSTQTGKSQSLMQTTFYRRIIDPFGMHKQVRRQPKSTYIDKLLFRSAKNSPKNLPAITQSSKTIKKLVKSNSGMRMQPTLELGRSNRAQSQMMITDNLLLGTQETQDEIKLDFDTEEWLNQRSEMFDYFALEKYKAQPPKVFSLRQAIREENRQKFEFGVKKFLYQKRTQMSTKEIVPLCDICRIEHPVLKVFNT